MTITKVQLGGKGSDTYFLQLTIGGTVFETWRPFFTSKQADEKVAELEAAARAEVNRAG